MKVAQFLMDYFKPSDEIKVNCCWLQDQLKAIAKYDLKFRNQQDLINTLQFKIDVLEAKIAVMELDTPLSLDISA